MSNATTQQQLYASLALAAGARGLSTAGLRDASLLTHAPAWPTSSASRATNASQARPVPSEKHKYIQNEEHKQQSAHEDRASTFRAWPSHASIVPSERCVQTPAGKEGMALASYMRTTTPVIESDASTTMPTKRVQHIVGSSKSTPRHAICLDEFTCSLRLAC